MMKNKIKNLDELKKVFEEFGYFANDEVITEAYLGLNKFGNGISSGQDVWAICLDGPAGAGKSSFVETYKDVASFFLDETVEFINYECNDTTGSSELIEEVGMVAVVLKDDKKIIIPGAIVRAIQKVNEGKKVILLIDEFDKSRKETDVFFYKFLQSGEVNTTQMSDLKIKPEYKSNLQVFFCKNDFRELSGPLSRRTRSLYLDYMKPELFYDIAKNKLKNKEGIDSLINLVTLIYEFAYDEVNKFDRLPAASEMLIAIEDAYDLTTNLNITGNNMYSLIFKRLFKDKNDYNTFEGLLSQNNDEKYKGLKKFLNDLKKSNDEANTKSIKELMVDDIFKSYMDDKTKELDEKIKELDDKIKNSDEKISIKLKELEEQKGILIKERLELRQSDNTPSTEIQSSIKLNGGDLVLSDLNSNIINNFDDKTEFIRRGENIFNSALNANWTEVLNMKVSDIDYKNAISKLITMAPDIKVKIYENGVLFNSDIINLIMICVKETDNSYNYKFLSNTQIIPSTYITSMSVITKIILSFLGKLNDTVSIDIKSLIYNDEELDIDKVIDNVYSVSANFSNWKEFSVYVNSLNLKCEDKSKVLESCVMLMDDNSKKLTLN